MERLKTIAIASLLICVIGQALYIDHASRFSQRSLTTVTVLSVIDGDTFSIDGSKWSPSPNLKWKIRVMGIDTPEMHGDCPAEREGARKAKELLSHAVDQSGGVVVVKRLKNDKWGGRFDADVYLSDGQSVKTLLLKSSLALPYNGQGHKPDWCRILQ